MLRRTQPILNFASERPDLCGPAFFNPVVRGGSKSSSIARRHTPAKGTPARARQSSMASGAQRGMHESAGDQRQRSGPFEPRRQHRVGEPQRQNSGSARIARRGEDEATLRDVFFLRHGGDMLVVWRGLDRSAPLCDESVFHIVETLQLKVDDGLRAAIAAAQQFAASAQAAPFAALTADKMQRSSPSMISWKACFSGSSNRTAIRGRWRAARPAGRSPAYRCTRPMRTT
jgi:hypothetical protein